MRSIGRACAGMVILALLASAAMFSQVEPADDAFGEIQIIMGEQAFHPQDRLGGAWAVRFRAHTENPWNTLMVLDLGDEIRTGLQLASQSPGTFEALIDYVHERSQGSEDIQVISANHDPLGFVLEDQIAAGHLHELPTIPVPAALLSVFDTHQQTAHLVSRIAFSGALYESPLTSRARNTLSLQQPGAECPDGNCTDWIRPAIERWIAIFKAKGLSAEAANLQDMLDDRDFRLDSEHEYTRRECMIARLKIPFGAPDRTEIAPECLSTLDPKGLIAAMTASIALRAENDELDNETANLVVMSLLFESEFEKLKQQQQQQLIFFFQSFAKIGNALGDSRLTTTFQILDVAKDYRGEDDEQTLSRLKTHLESIKKGLKEIGQQGSEIEKKAQRFAELLSFRNWELLEQEFGVSREDLDPNYRPIPITILAQTTTGEELRGVTISTEGGAVALGSTPFTKRYDTSKDNPMVEAPAIFQSEVFGALVFSHWVRKSLKSDGTEAEDSTENSTDPRFLQLVLRVPRDTKSITAIAFYKPVPPPIGFERLPENTPEPAKGDDDISDTKDKDSGVLVASGLTDIKFATFAYTGSSQSNMTNQSLANSIAAFSLKAAMQTTQSTPSLVTLQGVQIPLSFNALAMGLQLHSAVPSVARDQILVYQVFLDTGPGGRATEGHPGFTANYAMQLFIDDVGLDPVVSRWNGFDWTVVREVNAGTFKVAPESVGNDGVWISAPLTAIGKSSVDGIKFVIRTVNNELDRAGNIRRQIIDDWPNADYETLQP